MRQKKSLLKLQIVPEMNDFLADQAGVRVRACVLPEKIQEAPPHLEHI